MQFEHMHHIHFLYSLPTGSEVSISIDMEAEQDFMNRVSKYDFVIFNPCRKILETHSNIFPQFPGAQTNRLITYPIIGKLNFSVRKTNPGEFLITSFLYNIESLPGPIFGKTYQVQIEA